MKKDRMKVALKYILVSQSQLEDEHHQIIRAMSALAAPLILLFLKHGYCQENRNILWKTSDCCGDSFLYSVV